MARMPRRAAECVGGAGRLYRLGWITQGRASSCRTSTRCMGVVWRPLRDCVTGRFEDVRPVRAFRWSRGERHFPDWHWAATTGRHVGFESWLERDQLLLIDFDPSVVGIGSQPFWLHGHDGEPRDRS